LRYERLHQLYELPFFDLLSEARRVHEAHWPKGDVQLATLLSIKTGLCSEDCSYCSQSKTSQAEIPRYNFLNREDLLAGAQAAVERQACTYCIVISARGPNEREMAAVEQIVPEIKQRFKLNVCACLGLLTTEQAERLKACGVDRVNHNLNKSPC
jgi:biotin synthase